MIDALTSVIGAGTSAPAPVDPPAVAAAGTDATGGPTFDQLLAQCVDAEAAAPAPPTGSAVAQTAIDALGGLSARMARSDSAIVVREDTPVARRSDRPKDDP